jgi:hypothetical protein
MCPLTRRFSVSEGGLEHRQPPCQPVAPRLAEPALTRASAPHLPLLRDVVSNLVLTGPLANGLQGVIMTQF